MKKEYKKVDYSPKKNKRRIIKEGTRVYEVLVRLPEKKVLSHINETPYFKKDNFVLYHGDSLKILEELPENSIDMIFADPPYNLSI